MNRRFTFSSILVSALLVSCTAAPGYKKKDDRWIFISPRGIGAPPNLFPVAGADPASFHELADPLYAADKDFVYFRGDRIPDAIPSSFQHVTDVTWMDAHHVYFEGEKIEGADPATFQTLRMAPWSRDANACFRGRLSIPSSDPITFTPLNFMWARDKRSYFAYDHSKVVIVRCDYDSMRILSDAYAKDKERVFWLGREVQGADAATFEVIGASLGKDKFRRYGGAEEFWMDRKAK